MIGLLVIEVVGSVICTEVDGGVFITVGPNDDDSGRFIGPTVVDGSFVGSKDTYVNATAGRFE